MSEQALEGHESRGRFGGACCHYLALSGPFPGCTLAALAASPLLASLIVWVEGAAAESGLRLADQAGCAVSLLALGAVAAEAFRSVPWAWLAAVSRTIPVVAVARTAIIVRRFTLASCLLACSVTLSRSRRDVNLGAAG